MEQRQFKTRIFRFSLVYLVLFLGIFVLLEYVNVSLLVANTTHHSSWYVGKNIFIRNYNEAIELVKNQEFEMAKSLLSPLLNEEKNQYSSDIFELYGDIVYQLGGASGDILPFYKRSLEYKQNLRVQKKIILLESIQDTHTEDQFPKNGTGGSQSFASGSSDRDMKKQEIQRIQESRGGIVNFLSPIPGEQEEQVRGILQLLGNGEERKDW